MKQAESTQTVIPFTQRRRWRWWLMVAMGTVFGAFGLTILSSPAWAPRGMFGDADVWLWLRGQAYLVFGFMQAWIGVGYIRLTSRPAEAITANAEGISVRRLYGTNHLPWNTITEVKRGQTALTLSATPISIWKTLLCDPRLLRLDATMVDANMDQLAALVLKHCEPSDFDVGQR